MDACLLGALLIDTLVIFFFKPTQTTILNLTILIIEVSYYILTKMEADMNDEFMRNGKFWANVVFRGESHGHKLFPGFKEDFQLVPKEEEKYFIERTLPQGQSFREPTKVPRFKDLPPLIKDILIKEAIDKDVEFSPDELKLPIVAYDSEKDQRRNHFIYVDN